MKHPLNLGLPFSLVLVAAIAQAGGAEPEIVGDLPIGKLAFATNISTSGPPWKISILGQPTRPFDGWGPQFTADGRQLLYSHYTGRDGRSSLFIRDLSTNVSRKIDNRARWEECPSLSPNGLKLLFSVWAEKEKTTHIYVSDPDGSNRQPLTSGNHRNWPSSWSPDGTQVLFFTTRDDAQQIYVMDADGQNPTNLSNDKVNSTCPAWSPDGYRIAYTSSIDNQRANIFTMNRDGTDKKNISNSKTHHDTDPAWSPDGQWVAFSRGRLPHSFPTTKDNPRDIWIMKHDGTDQRQITRNQPPWESRAPAWSR